MSIPLSRRTRQEEVCHDPRAPSVARARRGLIFRKFRHSCDPAAVWKPGLNSRGDFMRRSAIAVFSIFVASPAIAATLGVPTQGYTYFHRAGADSIAHNAAIETCAANAASLLPPAIANTGGALGSLIDSIERDKVAKVNFAANLENCMTIKGWDVVRLDDFEGKSIANLEAPALSTVLAPWIGAETVHGQIVRQYQPIGNMPVTAADIFDSAGSSLSLASDLGGVNRAVAAVPERVNRPPWQVPEAEDDLSKISAGATLIVVRATTIAPAQASLEFAYLDKPEERNPMSADLAFIVPTPTRFFLGSRRISRKDLCVCCAPGTLAHRCDERSKPLSWRPGIRCRARRSDIRGQF